jgi:hypothetical protein
MDKYFNWFLEQFGQPEIRQEPSSATISKYRGKLPDQLLNYWTEYGFCGFKNGLYQIVNPEEYDHALQAWLGSTSIVEEDAYYVIARTGFGDLYVWGEKNGNRWHLVPSMGWVLQSDGNQTEIAKGRSDSAIQGFFATEAPKRMDEKDDQGNPLFARAVAKLGPLAPDEMFTFTLPVFLGGTRSLENISKVNVHVQLDLLAQYGYREILDRDALARKAFG